jgi:hypothetical protein
MQSPRPPSVETVQRGRLNPPAGRVGGWRAVIEFSPNPVSLERLCAGVVIRLTDDTVLSFCAIDPTKAASAFGNQGAALFEVANTLCISLAAHWQSGYADNKWIPPFEGTTHRISEFSAKSAQAGAQQSLMSHSSLHALLGGFTIEQATRRPKGIVARVKSAVSKDINSTHLTKRFNRELQLHADAMPLKVDFLGQNFACYFLQVVTAARAVDGNAERACGKLFELQALKRMIAKPRKKLGLLDEERPQTFELIMVGQQSNPVQLRVLRHIEMLADRSNVRALTVPTAQDAAGHVFQQERLAA